MVGACLTTAFEVRSGNAPFKPEIESLHYQVQKRSGVANTYSAPTTFAVVLYVLAFVAMLFSPLIEFIFYLIIVCILDSGVMAYGNDDISLFVSCLDILVSLGNLLQRIASINHSFYLPCLNQSIEEN